MDYCNPRPPLVSRPVNVKDIVDFLFEPGYFAFEVVFKAIKVKFAKTVSFSICKIFDWTLIVTALYLNTDLLQRIYVRFVIERCRSIES